MMKKTKKLFALLLIAVLFVQTMNATAMADPTQEEVTDEEEPLRYTYLSSIGAGITMNGSWLVTSATATISSNKDSRLIVTVLRSKTANGSYTTYTGWSKSFSGTGLKYINKSISVPSGYTYQLKVVCKIYNSSGTVIETATKYSSKVTYK